MAKKKYHRRPKKHRYVGKRVTRKQALVLAKRYHRKALKARGGRTAAKYMQKYRNYFFRATGRRLR